MPHHYIDPKTRTALPEIETWQDYEVTIRCKKHGLQRGPESVINDIERECPVCPVCGKASKMKSMSHEHAWFSWICIPGCDPDSDCFGPFSSEDAAVVAARKFAMSQP